MKLLFNKKLSLFSFAILINSIVKQTTSLPDDSLSSDDYDYYSYDLEEDLKPEKADITESNVNLTFYEETPIENVEKEDVIEENSTKKEEEEQKRHIYLDLICLQLKERSMRQSNSFYNI